MNDTSEFLQFKELYEQSKRNFPNESVTVVSDIEGRMSRLDKVKLLTNVLFIGNLIGEGIDSKKIIKIAMNKKLNVLRGTTEDTIIRLLDACEDEDSEQIHLYAAIFHANYGTRIMLNFAEDREEEIIKATKGKITHLGFLLPAIIDGLLSPEESGNAIALVLGINVINWIRSLPVAAIFSGSIKISKVNTITIVSYGGLSSEIKQDICYSTEKIAVWGQDAPTQTSSKSILYHLFPENLKPELISKKATMHYHGNDSNAHYIKGSHYTVSFNKHGDSTRILQITSKSLRKNNECTEDKVYMKNIEFESWKKN